MTCNHCNSEVTSKFCPNCGQATQLKRIDGHYIVHEIEHVLHFERGILYTIRELTLTPGKNIRRYLTHDRNRLVKPIIFIIVSSLIYTIISHIFHTEEPVQYKGFEKSAVSKLLQWVQGNYGYANILVGMFIAFWLKIFFKKYGYNFYEILIMLCFTIGMSMLIYAVFAIVEGIIHVKLFSIAGILGVVYIVWASANFFEAKKVGNYVKALLAFLLGSITFYILIFAIGLSIDLLTKH